MRTFAQFAALAVIVASGVAHGLWTGRWSAGRELEARAEGLEHVPMTIGDWKGRDLVLDRRSVAMAEIAGYVMRRYEDRRGDAVTVLLVCGRPGPIAVHTPEVCYGGAGYEPAAPKSRVAITAGPSPRPDEFWVADLIKPGGAFPVRLRILYAWTDDGAWRASESPRLDFASSPVLFKMYIVREMTGADEPIQDGPAAEFARRLLPEIRKALFRVPAREIGHRPPPQPER